jgi:MFS family permease
MNQRLAERLRATFRALKHRNYRLFFAGQVVSLVGTWAQQVAMGWLTWRLTGSPWLLGVVAFSANAGMLLLGSFAGVLTDRVDRRRALLVTQSLMMAQAITLALLTATGRIDVPLLVALALCLSVVQTFDVVLRQATYVRFVDDRADLANAIALNSMAVNAARVVGPAIAGFLLAVTSEAVCFAINAASFLAVLVALLAMRWPKEPPAKREGGLWWSFREGARFVAGSVPARALLALVAVLSFTIGPYSALMPVYASQHFAGGPRTLGLLLASAGAGALASTLWLAGRSTVIGLARVIARAALAAGLALAAFAWIDWLPAAMALLVVVGGGVILAAASANTILQTIVDDRLRGRVAGFYTLAFLGMAPLGNLAAGALANAVGVQWTFVVNGLVCALAALVFMRSRPAFIHAIRPVYRRLGVLPDE